MTLYRLSKPALEDLLQILVYTEEHFGKAARERYEDLILTALMDLAAEPERHGSRAQPELGAGVRVYHLRYSRDRGSPRSGRVRFPRHVILYRQISPAVLGVGRLLHDAMDLERHVRSDFGD